MRILPRRPWHRRRPPLRAVPTAKITRVDHPGEPHRFDLPGTRTRTVNRCRCGLLDLGIPPNHP
jgi:hypothetical protein